MPDIKLPVTSTLNPQKPEAYDYKIVEPCFGACWPCSHSGFRIRGLGVFELGLGVQDTEFKCPTDPWSQELIKLFHRASYYLRG